MSAIVTDQLRIINARKFIEEVTFSSNAYYSFVALTNPEDYQSDWDENPPAPKDCLNEEYHNWDTVIGLKRILGSDIRFAVKKVNWASGITYDMYRHDINRNNLSQPSIQPSSPSQPSIHTFSSSFPPFSILHISSQSASPSQPQSSSPPNNLGGLFIIFEPILIPVPNLKPELTNGENISNSKYVIAPVSVILNISVQDKTVPGI